MEDHIQEIIKELAETDSTYYVDNTGEIVCPFCRAFQSQQQWLVEHADFTHEPDCIVTKARTLMNAVKNIAHR